MNQKLNEFYETEARQLSASIGLLQQRGRHFVIAQLATFLSAIGCVVAYTLSDGATWWLLGVPVMLTAYVAVRRMDVHCSQRIGQLTRLRMVYEKEVCYQQGNLSVFDDGQRYADARHPYTFDLDIFGPQSLFQRLCRCVTTGGADALAKTLQSVDDHHQRSEALAELARDEPWRARFMAFGQEHVIDSAQMVGLMHDVSRIRLPRWFGSTAALLLACGVLGGFYFSVVLAVAGVIGGSVPFVWGVFQLFLVVGVASRSLRQVAKAATRLHRQLAAYADLLCHIGSASFRTHQLQSLQGQLTGPDGSALHSFTLLGSLVRGIDQRSNEMGIVLFNVFALFDFFLVRRFLHWQHHYLNRVEQWVDAVSQMDMLVSLATYRYNHPEAREAEVTGDSGTLLFEGRNLRHPFLGAAAVGNDFNVSHRHFYIVTGANMAGKSTFLRAVGISYVMAMQGLPVFADQLAVGRFRLFTSMRTTDDLTHGISYFNAELLRLRQLFDSLTAAATATHQLPTLIILDEILKGTNSLDKLNGSRLFLQTIARQDVTGIVATHDLELSRMADEHPDRFHNFCFEIELGTSVTYSYRITPGVARNQNATFLLRKILGLPH